MAELDLTEVHERLAAAETARTARARLEARLATARDAAATTTELVRFARARLARETADVRRLESFSPTRIWAGLRGTRDADLSREEAERQAADFEVARAESAARSADDQVARMLAEIGAVGDPDAQRAEALDAKEALLVTAGGATGADLLVLSQRIAAARIGQREAAEAIAAAHDAAGALAAAADHLGSAQGWATWDTFGGGGLVTDMLKYDRMDKAQALLGEANQSLHTLAVELRDVDLPPVAGVSIDGLEATFDVWFDNIFTDWSVRSRIADAADRVHDARSAVEQVLQLLTQRTAAWAADETAAVAERERLLRP